jgi:hypothetical protein
MTSYPPLDVGQELVEQHRKEFSLSQCENATVIPFSVLLVAVVLLGLTFVWHWCDFGQIYPLSPAAMTFETVAIMAITIILVMACISHAEYGKWIFLRRC